MSAWLVALPVLVPLATAVIALALRGRPAAARAASLAGGWVLLGASIALAARVYRHGIQVLHVGGWPAPNGIALVVDPLGAALVTVAAVSALAVATFAARAAGRTGTPDSFHAPCWMLVAGVCGAFVTGDLFNLYVWFEVLVVSSFVLLVSGRGAARRPGTASYVSLNVLASLAFLAALGLVYGMTGTLDMAELSIRLAHVEDEGARLLAAALLLFAFGTKAGVFPLFLWLPSAYPTAPPAVAALFAGLLTKVGVYALIRTFTLLFPLDEEELLRDVLLFVAAATMLAGVLGAAFQTDVRRVLSFHIVSQIGYMVLGLALFTPLALLGAVFYVVHHIVVKTSLFLLGGAIAAEGGSFELGELGGLARRHPALAAVFLVSALSLAGLPPLSGFWAKLLVVRAGLEAGEHLVTAVVLLVGLLTLYSMLKIWMGAFWGPETEEGSRARGRPPLAPMASLAAVTIAIGLFAEPVAAFSARAAEDLLEPAAYVAAVRQQGGR